MSLARPRDFVLLDIDNSVAFSYLSKSGGKVALLNARLRPFLQWLRLNEVQIQPRLVLSKSMKADEISRWAFHPSEYSLSLEVFNRLLQVMSPHCRPVIVTAKMWPFLFTWTRTR